MLSKKTLLRRCVNVFVFAVFFSAIANISGAAQDSIELSEPDLSGGKLLMQALKERKSVRNFNRKELPIKVLSNLLWAADGINRQESGKRTSPSARNWQEIDIYAAMKSGLYLYNAQENRLDPIMTRDIREFTGVQDFTQIAPVNLIYVSDHSKITGGSDLKAKEFYSAADTGFISQNVYLFCASEGLVTVVLGWVDKPALKKVMKLRDDQHITLTQPVGYPK
ncbi:SagB/ThcOx family dehydrogenase [Candidatus Auribacterota bacterium]